MNNILTPGNRMIGNALAEKAQANAIIDAEIRRTAIEIYARAVSKYLSMCSEVDPEFIKTLAFNAFKSAPYLHQAMGVVKIPDDVKHWDCTTPT